MPHALLLSPDDQAVSAITGVLEEMSVSCERPLDGASAAQKLNSNSFDLVVVDCENLPAAKLIFDVCRRGKNGNHPVPVAIVDGRAGLPTAFRLGAELILTKPVSKDQARNTIRNAVSRVRKELQSGVQTNVQTNVRTNVQTSESACAQPASEPPVLETVLETSKGAARANSVSPSETNSSAASTEEPVRAAAADASKWKDFAKPAAGFSATSAANAAAAARTAPTPAPTPTTSFATITNSAATDDEIDASPANPESTPPAALFSAPALSESTPAPAVSANLKPKPQLALSDGPALTEVESNEGQESQPVKALPEAKKAAKVSPVPPAADAGAPIFSAYRQGERKTRGLLVAVLVLALGGGGLYAAWMYQPEFRAVIEAQIDRLLVLTKIAVAAKPAISPAKPPSPAAAATTAAPASGSPTPAAQNQSTSHNSAVGSASSGMRPSAAASAAAPSSPSASAANAPTLSSTKPLAPVAAKLEVNQASAGGAGKDAAGTGSDTPLPGENSAIILSSKGAEKRLAQSAPPVYPAEAHAGPAEATVVLKEVVDENGKVEGVRLVEGDATLATAAIKAVKQWRYRPYMRDGKAQPFQTVVIIDFQRP